MKGGDEDGSSSRTWAFEVDAKRKDEAADEFARLAASLARHGFQHAAQSLLRVGREHRLFALKERAEAAAIRGDTDWQEARLSEPGSTAKNGLPQRLQRRWLI